MCPLFMLSTAWCQQNLSTVSTLFSEYHQNFIGEKIFVHTDKNFYVAGEIAWFKLYDVDASGHMPLELSKVAYVEIADSANKQVLQAKIALNNAEGNGSFYLPLSLNSGNYKLRAYTNWMKNSGAEYFFEKNITIINVQKRISAAATKPSNKFDIQFFPEGGNLVNNIHSVIAFKGTDQYGIGITFSGVLLDNADTILRFMPQHAGMGSFSFIPLSNHLYKAVIKTASGETVIKNLPGVYPSGYVMALTDTPDSIKIIVQSDILSREVYLFAHTREIIKVAAESNLQNGKAVFLFDKKLLGDGISHITVFNDLAQPVCERLYFKRPSKVLGVELTTDRQVYATRNKVSVHIQPGITELKNDSASLSMAVYRLDSLQSFDAPAINSYLLLTSDLKGFVEDPNYYFSKDDPKTNAALDNLMLTNGWRRFKWEDILNKTKPFFEYVPEYNGSIISGKVINTTTGAPGRGIETYISFPGFITGFNSCVSDSEGRIKFELKNFYGPSQAILQTNNQKDSGYRIDLTDPFSNNFSSTPFPAFTLDQAYAGSLREQSISMQVQNIYSGKNVKHFTVPAMDTTPFYIHSDENYLLDNYTRFTTIEEILREYVILKTLRKREGEFHISLFDEAYQRMFKNDPLILLDGVPVFDLNRFMQVDPLKLNKLEVLNRRYFLGSSEFEGILSWTSYKQDMADYDPGTHAVIIDYEGLQPEREFYTPVYTTEDQQMSHIPDFRNVLLWSPHIKIAGGASEEINFFTSDMPGKYKVLIQGISSSGRAGFATTTFTVAAASK
jgi:hypothetical protein